MALGCLLAWTALRRNDGSGLGVAYACAVGHPRRLDGVLTILSCAVGRPIRCGRVLTVLRVLGVLAGFKGWQTAGLDAHKKPKKPLLWPWGACWHGPR